MECFCTSLHLLGPILFYHLLILCGQNFLICGLMIHRCRIILMSPPSWIVWTFLHGLSQITKSCQMGCQIMGYQMIWSGVDWSVRGPSAFQMIGSHLGWEYTQYRHHVLLLLRIYPLVHWLLPRMNCEILLHHTVGLLFIKASSSCQHNRCMPCCLYHNSQYH